MSTSNPLLIGALSAITTTLILRYLNDGSQSFQILESEAYPSQLGPWAVQGKGKQTVPLGPQITARLTDKLCGVNEVNLSRIPQGETGSSSWSILLGVIQPFKLDASKLELDSTNGDNKRTISTSWPHIPLGPLTIYESQLYVKISRVSLMTLFALTNARVVISYSSASGYRSAYPSYCGQWSIAWPIGKPCVVRFSPHDSHSAKTDVYPPAFPARVDKCVEMMAGIISDGDWKIAFSGRAKHRGNWVLQERKKGFGGAHGSRHLYNMQGGKVFEVDLLAILPCTDTNKLRLQIPCLEGGDTELFVPKHEAQLLAMSLDCLPWSSLSWSLHRGLKDILLAYGKPVMNQYRAHFATILNAEAVKGEATLIAKGWAPEFVRTSMPGMAESAFLAGTGNSGDLVRVVVAVVETLLERVGHPEWVNLDRTIFWSQRQSTEEGTEPFEFKDQWSYTDVNMVVALTKFFVLEWSQELDYQLYHELPVDILLA